MTSKAEFLDEAIELLEDFKDGQDIYGRTREFLQRYYDSLERKPHTLAQPRNPYITKLFEKTKVLIANGANIKEACEITGLTRDQYNRRMRMQKQGRDRISVRD